MTCNYYEYHQLTEELLYGVALTTQHMNHATEKIRRYLHDGGQHLS